MSNELTDVRCHCGAEFPADSYDAGFIAGSGMCQNCDAAMPPKDIPALVDQAGGDERAAFEAAFAAMGRPVCRADYDQDAYGTPFDDGGWTGWQARAALAQPYPKSGDYSDQSWINAGCPPEQPEQAEAERPEVVAWQYRVTAGPQTGWSLWHPGKGEEFERSYTVERRPLMTVAQYDRIVGELRAVIAQLRQHKNDYMDSGQETYRALQNEIREREAEIARLDGLVSGRTAERDAANARLHEVATACATAEQERDAALARVAELEGKLTDWVHEGFRLNEALAVAKAQHSVPDDDMILQIFADNAEHSEQGDEHGYCIVREQHAQAIARKLLAAAPGNSAQHSVPEGWKLVPIEPLLNMMSDKDHDTRITAERQLLSILADVPGNSVPQAWIDVQAERRRQITAEGWTPEHDDLYCAAELPRAAAAYILNGANDEAPAIWPFVTKWWKPRDARSNYVRAGALILAEIERLDRARQGGRS